jgi:hypothetical protein
VFRSDLAPIALPLVPIDLDPHLRRTQAVRVIVTLVVAIFLSFLLCVAVAAGV